MLVGGEVDLFPCRRDILHLQRLQYVLAMSDLSYDLKPNYVYIIFSHLHSEVLISFALTFSTSVNLELSRRDMYM